MPSPYRQSFESAVDLVITNNQYQKHSHLDIYTLEEWQKLERKVAAMPTFKPQVQAYKRFYLASGQVVQTDAQSRLLIPAPLRKFAGLSDEVVLVGMGAKFEVWSASIWRQLFDHASNDLETIMEGMADLDGVGA